MVNGNKDLKILKNFKGINKVILGTPKHKNRLVFYPGNLDLENGSGNYPTLAIV